MAETTETVVFEVDVDGYEKSLADLTTSINALKQAQKQLAEQTKQGNQEAAKTLETTNAQLKIQQQQYRTTQNVLVGYLGAKQKEVDTIKFANNSIQTNRDLLKQLTAQYINLKKPSEEATQRIKDLSDTLKRQEGQIGDTRRNVGNYFNEFAKGIPVLGQVVDPLTNITKGFKDAGGGVAGLSASLGAGLLAVIPLVASGVGKIIDVFKDYKPIADAVEDSTAALSAGFRAFVLGGDVQEAANQAIEYTRTLRDLEDSQEIFNVTLAEGENQINRNILASKNSLATLEERKESLAAASRAEKVLLKGEQERIDKEISANEKIIVSRGKLTEAQRVQYRFGSEGQRTAIRELLEQRGVEEKYIEAYEKAITKRSQLDGKSLELRQKIANRLASLEEKEIKDAEKVAEEKKKNLERQQQELEKYNQTISSLSDEFLLNDRQKLAKSFDDKIALIKGTSQKEKDLIFAIEQDKQDSLDQFDAEALRKAKENADKKVKIEKKKNEEILQSDAELNYQLNQNALDTQKKQEDAIVRMVTDISNAISNILGAVSNLINQTAQENIDSLEQQAELGVVAQRRVDAEARAIKIKAWKQSKAIAITQAVMNTANAVMAQLSNPTPYVGVVLAALAAVMGGIQISTIAKQKQPTFAKGGVIPIGGKSHADGGTPVHVNGQQVAEVEKGEGMFIMKKDAYRDINMLSGWNQKYGGKSWNTRTSFAADGGMITIPTSDGGFSTREIKNTVDNAVVMETAIRNGFKNAPAPELSIVELSNKTRSRNRSVTISEL